MDLNYLLLWLVCFSCIIFLIQIARFPLKQSQGWMVVAGSILVLTGVVFRLSPQWAGWVGSAAWAILVILPLLTFKQVDRLVSQERYTQARQLASYLRWLHPADGWFEHPELLRALELGHQGDMDRAAAILNRYCSSPGTAVGRVSMAFLYRMTARWQELLLWLQQNFSEKTLLEDSSLVVFYLRALGELGDLNSLLQKLEQAEVKLEQTGNLRVLHVLRMFALAFGGQPNQVKQLFAGPLSFYSQNISHFWQATAEMAAGNEAVAREQLHALQTDQNHAMGNAIAWRLSHPPKDPHRILTAASQQKLYRISIVSGQQARQTKTTFASKTAYATYSLIGVNLLFFGIEILYGGSKNTHILYHLGALLPQNVWSGEWGRLLTSMFLHFGPLHLCMNMLGLYFLGNFVESALGKGRYLVIYFTSGIGSMLTIVLLAAAAQFPNIIVVGASGAIMGLIGAIGAVLLRDWQQERSRLAARRLRTIVFIIGLQIVFDFLTPQVSMTSHLSGLIIGFLVSNALLFLWPLKK